MVIVLCAVMGGLIGIVVNYLADVLPTTRKFSRPVCPHCKTPYTDRAYLISFKCPNCHKGPTFRFFVVLILSIAVSILVALFPFGGLNYWLTIPLIIFFGVILVIDIEHRAVLIETSITGLVLLFFYGFLFQKLLGKTTLEAFILTVVGGIAGFGIMILFYYFGILFSKILGKIRKLEINEVALGFGDVYVCSFLGFLTGWPFIVGAILIAVLASGVFSMVYLIYKSIKRDYKPFTAIPYAPFLILGAILVFYLN
jgi:prepilin signal peptidase PulO-like enzyme (type II secretory pathway)